MSALSVEEANDRAREILGPNASARSWLGAFGEEYFVARVVGGRTTVYGYSNRSFEEALRRARRESRTVEARLARFRERRST